jgi:SAM-dependent methyltransferase
MWTMKRYNIFCIHASNGLDVHAIGSSKVAIENINQTIRGKIISLHLRHFEARQALPFDTRYFDAVYSHMFYNMRFTDEELSYLFKESSRVLKNSGLLYFSDQIKLRDSVFSSGPKRIMKEFVENFSEDPKLQRSVQKAKKIISESNSK